MYLRKSKSNGKLYLSLVQGYRLDGKVKQKTIEGLGYLEDLEKLYPDPIAHFKKVAEERTVTDSLPSSINLSLSTVLADNSSLRKNLGYAVLKSVYSMLDIREFFQSKQKKLNIDYNLNSIFSLLTFNRFLFPSSKKHAYDTRDIFFDSYKFSLDDTYRSLDHFSRLSTELQQYLHQKVNSIIGRNNQLGYYDVTNYYFEIPYEDEDTFDESGNLVKKGQRKRDPSKEHRKDPIVQMGLLMDSNGIPMAFNIFSGGESEKTSLLPTVKRVKKDFDLNRIIIVADRGLNSSDNTAFLSGVNHDDMNCNDGYVYGQSILGGDKDFKKWVLNQKNYVIDDEIDKNGEKIKFKHKSRIFAKTIQLKNSNGNRTLKMDIYQKQMVYYSKKYADKQKKDRDRVLAKANDLIANPGKYTKATSYGAAAYISDIQFSKETGEISNGQALSLDLVKIQEEQQYDGYYSIVTSEKHLTNAEIRNIYKGLWEIEESFKIIKSEFKARPIHVALESHVEAHFLICFVSLIIIRVLEHLLEKKYTIKEIRNALINYSTTYLDQNYYVFDYRDNVIKAIETVFNIDFSKKYMTLAEIKNILKYKK